MLKILTFIVPFILKGATSRTPGKSLAGQSAIYGLIFFGSLSLLFAIFTWLLTTHSIEVAFLGVGIVLLLGALVIKFEQWRNRPQPTSEANSLPPNIENDALAAHIPDSLKDDPLLKKILVEISDKPLAATVTALTLGMLLSREYFD